MSVRQQINLYQPIFSEERKPLSSRTAAVVLGVVIASLIGYSIYEDQQVRSLSASVDALRAQHTELETLAMAAEEEGPKSTLADAEARVKALEASLQSRRGALEVLRTGAAGQPSGFAARMEALARRHVEGLWLDKLVLSGTHGSMSLSGSTLDADTVPIYLQNLAQDGVLSGTRFDEFVIERPASAAGTSSEADRDAETKKRSGPQHIRFRAGSKALGPATDEAEAAT